MSIDTASAKAVLGALQNPSLSHEDALKIAAMPGNQGILRKGNEFKIAVNNQSFANALYAAARGVVVTDPVETYFSFDEVKAIAPRIAALVKEIDANPAAFQKSIEERIALYSPADSNIRLEGYVVAGGDGGGYTFGSTDFYMNAARMEDLLIMKDVTVHELYHAVQGAFAKSREVMPAPTEGEKLSPARQVCVDEAQLFANVYEEGTANVVEDMEQLKNDPSEIAKRKMVDFREGIQHVRWSASLLEMSVISLSSAQPMSYDDVYDVGFYGHGVLYNIGYSMAKAIADQDGAQGLAAYLKLPPPQMVLDYTKLPLYGKDDMHPKLGANTVVMAERLLHGCK